MVAGAGANITVQIGDHSVAVVDTGFERLSEDVFAEVRRLTSKPIRYIINTTGPGTGGDHIGGTARLVRAGPTAGSSVEVIGHENLLKHMSAGPSPVPSTLWPTTTYFTTDLVRYNGEGIHILHQPARTDGDSIVFFRRSDVISTGDIFDTTGYPVIDRGRGGSINGVIAALTRVIDLAIPERNGENGTLIVPGHGRVSDQADVVEYRDMLTIIRDRVEEMVKKGMTLDQVKASRPTRDYDPRYGADTGAWTTDMFIEAVYRSVSSGTRAAPGGGSNGGL
jgi:glyoxylase-like metal-dependent hydrolase (beta-lactamase superfamily II)